MKKYLTNILYIEFLNECIEMNFTTFITYKDYYSLTRLMFNALFKYIYQLHTTDNIFLLRNNTIPVTQHIYNVKFDDFKPFILNYNKILFKNLKTLTFYLSTTAINQIDCISELYKSDTRYKHISAKQYSSQLYAQLKRKRNITPEFDTIETIFYDLKTRIIDKWHTQCLDTSLEMMRTQIEPSNMDTVIQTIMEDEQKFNQILVDNLNQDWESKNFRLKSLYLLKKFSWG